MRSDGLVRLLRRCDPDRIDIHPHAHERAKGRNIDITEIRKALKDHSIVDVRDNPQSDPRFEYSYKVTVEVEGRQYEMPVYFNVPGTKLLIKSIWPRA